MDLASVKINEINKKIERLNWELDHWLDFKLGYITYERLQEILNIK